MITLDTYLPLKMKIETMNEFKFDEINDFDHHISSSISGYKSLRNLISNVSTFFIKRNSTVIDIGCTSGATLKELSELSSNVRFVGFDIIDKHFIKCDNVSLIKQDVTDQSFEIPKNNLTLCVFTLQFLDINQRLNLLKKIYSSLEFGGALIICEKEFQTYGVFQEIFTFSNYSYKQKKFSSDEILFKESQLRSSMTCLTEEQNENLFKKAGFIHIETFFKSLQFKGYLCLKSPN